MIYILVLLVLAASHCYFFSEDEDAPVQPPKPSVPVRPSEPNPDTQRYHLSGTWSSVPNSERGRVPAQ